jgi:hypothetical protein
MGILTQQEILDLVGVLINTGADTRALRPTMLSFLPPLLATVLPISAAANAQLMGDLHTLNNRPPLPDGGIPIAIFLTNLEGLFQAYPEALVVIRTLLSKASQRASGAPAVAPKPAETQVREVYIHGDDTVSLLFFEVALEAARGVAKLLVPRYQGGQLWLVNDQPVKHMGTGWLLSHDLLITNHHVINARSENEPPAATADFTLQAEHSEIYWDFNRDGVQSGAPQIAEVLELADEALDYAILRIPAQTRAPLARSRVAPVVSPNSPVPCNVIQHPFGKAKRFGIRNNLLHNVSGDELRYFTDTETGSSGSPVLDDRWQVVGLHRAGTVVNNVVFQGKPTAFVNLGSLWTAIAADIRAKKPELATEIGA